MTPKELERKVPAWIYCREDREHVASKAWLKIVLNSGESLHYTHLSLFSVATDMVRRERTAKDYAVKVCKEHFRTSVNLFGCPWGYETFNEALPNGLYDKRAITDLFDNNWFDIHEFMDAKRVMSMLSEAEQTAIRLVAGGFTAKEASHRMGITVAAYKSMLYRAQKKARSLAGMAD